MINHIDFTAFAVKEAAMTGLVNLSERLVLQNGSKAFAPAFFVGYIVTFKSEHTEAVIVRAEPACRIKQINFIVLIENGRSFITDQPRFSQ